MNKTTCFGGGIGRPVRFKLWCPKGRVGSSPTRSTDIQQNARRVSWRFFLSFGLPVARAENMKPNIPSWRNWQPRPSQKRVPKGV